MPPRCRPGGSDPASNSREHPARLNFGDCFTYALAIDRGEPLLYNGEDFSHTDVRSALD